VCSRQRDRLEGPQAGGVLGPVWGGRRGTGIEGAMTKAAAVEEALGHEVFEVGLEVLTVEGKAKGARHSRQ